MTGAEPVLTGVARAGDVVPGMAANVILTSGPPMPWDRYDGGQRNAVIYGALYEGLAAGPGAADAGRPGRRDTAQADHRACPADGRRAAQPQHRGHHPVHAGADAPPHRVRGGEVEAARADGAAVLLRQRLLVPAAVDGS